MTRLVATNLQERWDRYLLTITLRDELQLALRGYPELEPVIDAGMLAIMDAMDQGYALRTAVRACADGSTRRVPVTLVCEWGELFVLNPMTSTPLSTSAMQCLDAVMAEWCAPLAITGELTAVRHHPEIELPAPVYATSFTPAPDEVERFAAQLAGLGRPARAVLEERVGPPPSPPAALEEHPVEVLLRAFSRTPIDTSLFAAATTEVGAHQWMAHLREELARRFPSFAGYTILPAEEGRWTVGVTVTDAAITAAITAALTPPFSDVRVDVAPVPAATTGFWIAASGSPPEITAPSFANRQRAAAERRVVRDFWRHARAEALDCEKLAMGPPTVATITRYREAAIDLLRRALEARDGADSSNAIAVALAGLSRAQNRMTAMAERRLTHAHAMRISGLLLIAALEVEARLAVVMGAQATSPSSRRLARLVGLAQRHAGGVSGQTL